MTSKEIKKLIEQKYCGGYVTCFEVAPLCGACGGYVDAVTMGIWPSTNYSLHGFEIKISRSDFLREMKHPEKSYAKNFCDFWWLVTPKNLVDPMELPEGWGLLEASNGRLRMKKQAPKLDRKHEMGFIASIVRRIEERKFVIQQTDPIKSLRD